MDQRLGPVGASCPPESTANARPCRSSMQNAIDCAKEGLQKGCVPWICAAGRVLVPNLLCKREGLTRARYLEVVGQHTAVASEREARRTTPPSTQRQPPYPSTAHTAHPWGTRHPALVPACPVPSAGADSTWARHNRLRHGTALRHVRVRSGC